MAKCLSPIYLQNPQWNGPNVTKRITRYMAVDCGKCANCLRKKRSQWQFRLYTEHLFNPGIFITLTYDDDHLPLTDDGIPTVTKQDPQKFMKRVRKHLEHYNEEKKIKYFLCSEYGCKDHRPHYHLLLFGITRDYARATNIIEKCWKLGFNTVRPVTPQSVNYVAKYFVIPQADKPEGAADNFSLSSQGLGLDYLSPAMVDYIKDHKTQSYFLTVDGQKRSIPRYYKDKLQKIYNVKLTSPIIDDSIEIPEGVSPQDFVNKQNADIFLENHKFFNRLNSKLKKL